MNQTSNYGFSQWDAEDRILREDFNADNLKTEQALAGLAEGQTALAAQMANCGNCRVMYGSYTGSGKSGSENPNKLTFDHKLIYALVIPGNKINNTDANRLHLLRGVPYSIGQPEGSGYTNTVSWTDTDVQWYGNDTYGQFNASGYTYHYFALLAADE